MHRRITAAIFDMDGLMLDTELIYRHAARQAATECGITLTDEHFCHTVGLDGPNTERALLRLFGDTFPLIRYREAYRAAKLRCFAQTPIPPKPGLTELLDFLHARRLPLAVATSTRRAHALQNLHAVNVADRFHAIVGGDQVTHGKPAPDIYLQAAAALATPPQQCLVLEDSEPGVAAAHAAAMTVIMVPDLVQPTDQTRALALRVLPSLLHVRDFLQSNGTLS